LYTYIINILYIITNVRTPNTVLQTKMNHQGEPQWISNITEIQIFNVRTKLAQNGLHYYDANNAQWVLSWDANEKKYVIYTSEGHKIVFNTIICGWVLQ
jgi:hypothetical protein